jgi:hypothetical protein
MVKLFRLEKPVDRGFDRLIYFVPVYSGMFHFGLYVVLVFGSPRKN